MKNKLRIYYDEEGDFLEIAIGKPTECYAQEAEEGVFLRLDNNTGKVKSIGILGFKKRLGELKEAGVNLPVEVNFSEIKSSA